MDKVKCESCGLLEINGKAAFPLCGGVKPPTAEHICPSYALGTPVDKNRNKEAQGVRQ